MKSIIAKRYEVNAQLPRTLALFVFKLLLQIILNEVDVNVL